MKSLSVSLLSQFCMDHEEAFLQRSVCMSWIVHSHLLSAPAVVFFLLCIIDFPLSLLLLRRFSRVRLCATPETAAHQAPLSLGFSRQEHWSGSPFPSPMSESEK